MDGQRRVLAPARWRWCRGSGLSIYSAAKAGVIGLTKSAGEELATTGVLVNAITPAVIAPRQGHLLIPPNAGSALTNRSELAAVRTQITAWGAVVRRAADASGSWFVSRAAPAALD